MCEALYAQGGAWRKFSCDEDLSHAEPPTVFEMSTVNRIYPERLSEVKVLTGQAQLDVDEMQWCGDVTPPDFFETSDC